MRRGIETGIAHGQGQVACAGHAVRRRSRRGRRSDNRGRPAPRPPRGTGRARSRPRRGARRGTPATPARSRRRRWHRPGSLSQSCRLALLLGRVATAATILVSVARRPAEAVDRGLAAGAESRASSSEPGSRALVGEDARGQSRSGHAGHDSETRPPRTRRARCGPRCTRPWPPRAVMRAASAASVRRSITASNSSAFWRPVAARVSASRRVVVDAVDLGQPDRGRDLQVTPVARLRSRLAEGTACRLLALGDESRVGSRGAATRLPCAASS